MHKSKKFASMPVISLEEGQKIGVVKGLAVDPDAKRVEALIIEQKGWFKEQRFIPYHKIHSVGSDAITVEKSSGVERAVSLPDIVKLLKEPVGIIGTKLVAENGTVIGIVDEYYVDIASGTIAGLEFSGNFLNGVVKGHAFLDIAYVRTLGKEVLVITNEALENIFKLDGGLQETVKSIKDSTGQFWESTVQKTKEFSSTINKSLEKVKRDKKNAPVDEDIKVNGVEAKNPGFDSSIPEENPVESHPVDLPPLLEEEDQEKAAKLPPGSNGAARKEAPPPP